MTLPTKEKVREGIEDAIKNCNRNLHKWIEDGKRDSKFTITHTELTGLVKNWLVRRLKHSLDVADVQRALRHGNLTVYVDHANNCVSSIWVWVSRSYWTELDKVIELISEAAKDIDYQSLRYNPSDYTLDIYEPLSFNLSSIENIKF